MGLGETRIGGNKLYPRCVRHQTDDDDVDDGDGLLLFC